ncbi:MAG: sigma 54-interacting transcriptional regulator [Verrucomicrobiales bacterium]|nr:sigma 54-interacting transcriptional regulator [Verrucomicrobiales bacterium]
MKKLLDECLPGCSGIDAQKISLPTAGAGCRVVDELSLLFDISYTLESSLELREVIRPVLLKMADGLGMKRGTITILNREDGTASISEAVGLPGGQSQKDYLIACRDLVQQVIESGQAIVVPDISKEPGLKKRWEQEQQVDPRSLSAAYICVPIKFGEEVIGALSVERILDGRVRLSSDRRLLSLIANVIAHTVHFHRLTQEKLESLQRENERLQHQLQTSFRPPNMIGNSDAMRSVYRHIEQVAGSVTTVLIRGESGVGKELIARALHEQSPRKGKAFVKFNCAALPESIIESELFGHEKGAFTGAIAMRKGRFEVADGGTIFLDEIGDVSAATQVKLLRVLQEKEFERVGGHTPIKADVRILTATSRNLEQMIEQDKFRADLYYRLNVFPIYAPPLRERKSDILLLADYFVEKYAKLNQKTVRRISTAAIDLLMSYHWPGNVRELENCIERAVLLSPGKSIEANHLPPTLQKKDASEKSSASGTLETAVSALEYEMIVAELKACDGNMAAAARRLGITERQMGLRVKGLGIDFKRFRRGDAAAA